MKMFSYPSMLTFVHKNRLIETVPLSTHNICFGWQIRKIILNYALLSRGLSNKYMQYIHNTKYTRFEKRRMALI